MAARVDSPQRTLGDETLESFFVSIKYGRLDEEKPRKPRQTSQIVDPATLDERLTPDALERRLLTLAFQNRAPSVAKAAAAELLERKAPRVKNPEQGLTANEARKLTDIYDRLFLEMHTA